MPSILLVAFIVQLAIHIVNTIGAAVFNTLLWELYNRLPTSTSKEFREQKKLQAEYLATRQQLNATSPQDQFAKWAKIRRTHDKQLEQLEKKKTSLDATKAKFDKTVSTLRWICTNGLRLGLQFWYSKEAMFWLPRGCIPYLGEWLLSFPRAPLGSVSIQAWQMACSTAIQLASDAIIAIIGLFVAAKTGQAKKRAEPMKAAGEKTAAGTQGTAGAETKKEL